MNVFRSVYLILHLLGSLLCASGLSSLSEDPLRLPFCRRLITPPVRLRVSSAAEDEHNRMWLGTTNDGVWCYDGFSWKNKGLTDQPVQDVMYHPGERTIYAATDISVYVFRNGTWQNILPFSDALFCFGSSFAFDSQGRLWTASLWGPIRIEKGIALLFTTPAVAERFSVRFPELECRIIPEHALGEPVDKNPFGLSVITSLSGGYRSFVYHAPPHSNLQPGDEIKSLNGAPTVSQESVDDSTGDSLSCSVIRNGKRYSSELTRTSEVGGTFMTSDVFIDSEGDVFFLFFRENMLVRYSPYNDSWKKITVPPDAELNRWGTERIQEWNNSLYILGSKRIYSMQANGKMTVLPKSDGFGRINKFRCSKTGILMIAGNDHTVKLLRPDNTVHQYSISNFDVFPQSVFPYFHSDQSLWLFGDEIFRLDPQGVKAAFFPTCQFISSAGMKRQLMQTPDSVIQMKNRKPKKVILTGLKPEAVISCFEDSTHRLFLLHGDGNKLAVYVFDSKSGHAPPFLLETAAEIEDISSVQTPQGIILVTIKFIDSPLHDLGTQRFELTCTESGISMSPFLSRTDAVLFHCTTAYDKTWFAVTSLFSYDGTSFEKITEPAYVTGNRAIASFPQGPLWLVTPTGIAEYNNVFWRLHNSENRLPMSLFTSVIPLPGNEALALHKEGVSRYDAHSEIWSENIFQTENNGKDFLPFTSGCDVREGIWYNSKKGTLYYQADTSVPETYCKTPPERIPLNTGIPLFWNGRDFLDETPHDKLEFSWKIGDGEWSAFKAETSRILTDLKAGEHSFSVRARDRNFNIDPTPAEAVFMIVPPIWHQTWFLLVIAIMLCIAGVLLYIAIQSRIKQLKSEKEATHRILQADEMKLRLFTGISHELRTPLTLILGPLEQLLADKKEDRRLKTIRRNANRLLRIVNELLDYRKLESGRLVLEPARADFVEFIRDILVSFEEQARNRRIQLTLKANPELIIFEFDPGKMDKVVHNLVANAMKHTPPKGSVTVSLEKALSGIVLSVNDTGPGISPGEEEAIFQLFHQGKTKIEGSGVGLSFARELVELHGGSIRATNSPDGGASFIVTLPAEVNKDEEILNSGTVLNESNDFPLVLIVDDDPEIRAFLETELTQEYRIIEAENGEEALETATRRKPDLIVTDVMMPVMDGLEFTRNVRKTTDVSHTPVIMLTARGSDLHEVEGLDTGADDYLGKPFKVSVLKARIRSLLDSRRMLRERFSKEINVAPKDIAVTSRDSEFLEKAIEIVEAHIDETDFEINELAEQLFVSRRNLYNKLKAITGMTASEFIKTIRLKRAAVLLKEGGLSVSETSVSVGFGNFSYFRRCFKKQFGVSPSDYKKS